MARFDLTWFIYLNRSNDRMEPWRPHLQFTSSFQVYKHCRQAQEYHSTTFYSQLSMTKHNCANFSRQKDNTTDLPTPISALSMRLMPPDVKRTTRARIVQGPD